MSDLVETTQSSAPPRDHGATQEAPLARTLLIGLVVTFLFAFLVLPLALVFSQALNRGAGAYWSALADPDTLSAMRLTLLVAAIALPLNLVFGLVASWAIARFDFVGKSLLVALIDLPFSVSPVVSGIVFVLLFGAKGLLGPFLAAHGIAIIFAVPGIVLATLFVTFPFVAREVIPLMEQQGRADEEAALTLGATPLKLFVTVTLPNIRWGLLYGVLLCNARAMGEFGAVSVVSGHIIGGTNTLPLQIQILYEGNEGAAAFAVASLLAMLALVTLAAQTVLAWRQIGALARGASH